MRLPIRSLRHGATPISRTASLNPLENLGPYAAMRLAAHQDADMLKGYAVLPVITDQPTARIRRRGVKRQDRRWWNDEAPRPEHAEKRHVERVRGRFAAPDHQRSPYEPVLAIQQLYHLLEKTARQRELVTSPALHAKMREQPRTMAGHRDRVEPAGAEEAGRRGRGARHVEKAAGDGTEDVAYGARRRGRDQRREGTRRRAEARRRFEQHQRAYPLRVKRREDRGQCPA